MSDKTSIQWTDATWNPTRGCSRKSPGCGGANHQGGCYAERIAARFSEPGMAFHGFAERTANGGRWTGKLALVEDALTLPLRWRKPRRIFVNSMSDLFHEALPDEAIDEVLAVMVLTPHHTHQVLTKRDERMRTYFDDPTLYERLLQQANVLRRKFPKMRLGDIPVDNPGICLPRHIWLGVSIEDAERTGRIDNLRAIKSASVRFLSLEPLLEDLGALHLDGIHWAIVGGESGPRSRPFHLSWASSIIAQCRKAGVAVFVKQLGADAYDDRSYVGCSPRFDTKDRKGGDMSEWPEDLRVREFPS